MGCRLTAAAGLLLIAAACTAGNTPVPSPSEAAGPATAMPAPSATVDGFTPSCGVVGGSVTVTGSGFSGANGVIFETAGSNQGIPAVNWAVVNDTTATATVPAGAAYTGSIRVSTPGRDYASPRNFTVVPAGTARIWTSPENGEVGASVVITGRNFCGTKAVSFNTTPATTFTVRSSTRIIAKVPAGATTGPLHVTTPSGTADSFTDFTLRPATRHRRHDRSVSLTLRAVLTDYLTVGGTVTVADGFDACRSFVTVDIQRLTNGVWKTAGPLLRTGSLPPDDGDYHAISWPNKTGRYRATVKRQRSGGHDICLAATSPTVYHHRHH